MAVYSLLHFPSSYLAQALPGTLPYGVRTFLDWQNANRGHPARFSQMHRTIFAALHTYNHRRIGIQRSGFEASLMQDNDIPLALTYDDVLLVPRRSRVTSRSAVDTTGRLTPNIALAVPIVSANMDTVTEWRMAIAVARAGGIGIVHRFLTIEEQAAQVRKVKRSESYVIETPYTTSSDLSIRDVVQSMRDLGVHGLPVVDAEGRLEGLITRRDLVSVHDDKATVADAMTPVTNLTTAATGITSDDARTLMAERRVEKLPLVDDQMHLVGLITMKDIEHSYRFPLATKDERGRLRVGAAIGVRGDFIDRAKACADAGVDVLCLDIAHGHAEHALEAVTQLREAVDVELIAGNVATADGARDLIAAGAHAIKVGVGPGSVCTTRIVAGVGVPQLSAVLACAKVCFEHGVPLCADGGVRIPADVSKAVAAGAETVMVGNLFAGATESPGRLLERDGRMLKVHRGMASRAGMDRRAQTDAQPNLDSQVERQMPWSALDEAGSFGQTVPEGVEAVVPHRGDAASVMAHLSGGLRSAMSYSNAYTIGEYHSNAQFVRITTAGQVESHPHDVEV